MVWHDLRQKGLPRPFLVVCFIIRVGDEVRGGRHRLHHGLQIPSGVGCRRLAGSIEVLRVHCSVAILVQVASATTVFLASFVSSL